MVHDRDAYTLRFVNIRIAIEDLCAYAYLTLGHVEMPYFVSFSCHFCLGSPGKCYMVGTLATEQCWTKHNAIRQCPPSVNWKMDWMYISLLVPRELINIYGRLHQLWVG